MKTRITLTSILFLSFFTIFAQDQEFFLNDWQPKTVESPAYINTPQPTDPATVIVTVDFADTLSRVSKYIYGNNGVPWAGKMNNDVALMKDIKNLQPNVLRWPGGNLSQEHFWDAVEGGGPTDIPPTMEIKALNAGMNTSNWAMTVNDYYDMLAKTNSTGCICVNYSYARYGTGPNPVATAAHYAANWVRYDNGRTKLWEIGNENMGPWEAGYAIDTALNQDGQPKIISGDLYGRHSRVFIDSMKSAAAEVGSEIKIGVVVEGGPVTWDPVMKDWNKTMLPENADKADFLIVHSYYTPHNQNSDVATILNSPSQTKAYKDFILNDLKKYGGNDNLPIALTEWNIFAVGSKQAVSFINGMHATMIFGELAKNEYGQAMRWDLMNGWGDGDDHGLFARQEEPGVDYGEPHAPFYYMYYFQKYFGDKVIQSSVAGSSSVISYASSFSSGQSGIVLVNKGSNKQIVNLQLENMPDAKSYFRYVLTGGTDNGDFSRKVYVNGKGTNLAGGGPTNYETIEAFGKSIFGDIKIETPPLSVTYVLVTNDSIPPLTAINLNRFPEFKIFPNPTNGEVTIQNSYFRYDKVNCYNVSGTKVYEQVFDNPVISSKTFHLNVEPGVYIINLYQGNQKISKKMLVK